MVKKALKIVATVGLLLAGYTGYLRVFAVVAAHFRPASHLIVIDEVDRITASETALAATHLASSTFGANHWTTKASFRYYNNERGYWMFAESYERRKEGRQIVFRPFAIIWRSKDGRTLKTVTGREMIADFDEPFDVIKPGAKSGHVVHAQIIDEVRIRDDKGTPEDRSDDMEIGPLTAIEFDEPKLQITSDSEVIARDRDTTITGKGLLIELRPNDETGRTGFNGAKSVHILKTVHIYAKNAGRSGILPGTAKGGTPEGPTPIDLQCAGEMKVVLPDPPPQATPLKPGEAPPPPPPPQPTLAWFYRNVRVRRGDEKPDELDCDELFLTMMPPPKPATTKGAPATDTTTGGHAVVAEAPAADSPAGSDGPLTELTLKRAEATGHAVWLRSKAQNSIIRGNQLIHEKFAPAEPDKTYMCGNSNNRLLVEKYEYLTAGPNVGKLRSIDTIRTVDVTIFDNGQTGGGFSTIVARGPGILETRAERGGPVERTATWQDQCIIRTEGENDQVRRVITLYGNPHVADPASGSLDATKWIMAWLRPQEPGKKAD
ncbi:MAG TPA: hypothetical protein VGZ22_06050, partial [Isosphaeraceae bacterium]|nr:hypothetical protein [Isosphaeraceae bacterium]